MHNMYQYKPVQFFLSTLTISLIMGFAAAYMSFQPGMALLQLLCMFIMLCAPCTISILMIYRSKNTQLQRDFKKRLQFSTITGSSLLLLTALMPAILCLATVISLFFGYSLTQFKVSPPFAGGLVQVIASLALILSMASLEELGWRGYGMDSLHERFTVFTSSMFFGALWALWHVPLFLIKDYYQYTLWQTSGIYALNFIISTFPATIILNWLYYKNNRNIIIAILFHAMVNLFSMLFLTEQFTKCIITVLLLIISSIMIMGNKKLFFTVKTNNI